MSERAAHLAERFEATNAAFIDYIAALTDEQWLTLVPNEQRSVAAMAHHIAWGYILEIEPFHAIALGETPEPLTRERLDSLNAEHAAEYAECDREETIGELRSNAQQTAVIVRSLSDEQLGRAGRYVDWAPAIPVRVWIERVLIGHITGHLQSIREALATPEPA
jgi:hypothetical protein